MIRTIVVPLDLSSWSEHALPVAGRIARTSGSTVHLVHVYVPIADVDVAGYDIGGVPIVDPSWNAERRQHATAYLAAQTLGTDGPVTTALLDGAVVEALTAYIALAAADLVVMTTHGRGGLARLWLGSVADGLVRHCAVPILLVRPHDPTAEQQQPALDFKRILVPLDGSTLAEQILEPALMLARPMRAALTLVRVVEPFALYGFPQGNAVQVAEQATASLRDEAQQYLEGVAERLRADDLVVSTRVVTAEHPPSAILDDAQEHDADLIAMATHGRGGLARMLVGSVADKVLRGADRPVLLYWPRDER